MAFPTAVKNANRYLSMRELARKAGLREEVSMKLDPRYGRDSQCTLEDKQHES